MPYIWRETPAAYGIGGRMMQKLTRRSQVDYIDEVHDDRSRLEGWHVTCTLSSLVRNDNDLCAQHYQTTKLNVKMH